MSGLGRGDRMGDTHRWGSGTELGSPRTMAYESHLISSILQQR